MTDVRSLPETPFAMLGGGEELVQKITRAFYARMPEAEPELAALHQQDEAGRIAEATQARFALFFIQWLGGERNYSSAFGHPRLRMRHAHVPIDVAMRDAWLRCMSHALDEVGVTGDVRRFLDARLSEVADFLRNTPES